jgi:hypothetical protein
VLINDDKVSQFASAKSLRNEANKRKKIDNFLTHKINNVLKILLQDITVVQAI